ADDDEVARRERWRDRSSAGPAGRQGRARARERARQEGEEGAGDVRAAHPRHHEGLARDRVVPLRSLVPGDDQGADRRLDRGQGRPPPRSEGERDHREADPGAAPLGSKTVSRSLRELLRPSPQRGIRLWFRASRLDPSPGARFPSPGGAVSGYPQFPQASGDAFWWPREDRRRALFPAQPRLLAVTAWPLPASFAR